MTISTTTFFITYTGNGSTTAFTFPFVPDAAAYLVVYLTNLSTGVVTILDPSTYTVVINAPPTGGLWGIGGTVTYPNIGSPLTSSYSITIQRAVPYEQLISISNQGAFYPQAVEQALDILEMQIQQLAGNSQFVLLGNQGTVLAGNGATIDATFQNLGSLISTYVTQFYTYPVWIQGTTSNAEIFSELNITTAVHLPVGLTGSVFTVGVNPTANTTLTLKKNGSSIGTIVFNTSGSPTVTFTTQTEFASGDQFSVTNQATADTTAANFALSFVFTVG